MEKFSVIKKESRKKFPIVLSMIFLKANYQYFKTDDIII